MSKHTPGPWLLREIKDGGIVHLCPVTEDKLSILTVVDQDGYPFGAIYNDADARLIAAAPELLNALRDVIGWVPGASAWHTDAPMKAVERARSVIAKATGESA